MITRDSSDGKVISSKGEKNVKVKNSGKDKLGYTIGVTCTLSRKLLNSLLIWPTTGKKKFNVLTPSNIWIEYRKEGSWIDTNVFYQYLRNVVKPYFRDKKPANKKGILFLDGHDSHKKKEMQTLLEPYNVKIIIFPPNCTGLIQPCDIGINRSLKAKYREIWEIFNADPESNRHLIAIHKQMKKGKVRPLTDISNETYIKWISMSLKNITSETIKNSWKPLTSKDLDQAFIQEEDQLDENIEKINLDEILKEINEKDDEPDEIDDDDFVSNLPGFCEEMLDFEIDAEDTEIINLKPLILK